MVMYPTRYHRPADLDDARAALHRMRRCDLSRGRTHLAADAQAAACAPVRSHRSLRSPGLAGISLQDGVISIGATTRHADVAASPVVRRLIPALAGLAGSIGDRHVRHRGTIGGSVANNDPAADYPAAVLGLGATVVTDRRRIAADDYFIALYETALAPGEIITRIEFPIPAPGRLREIPQPRVALRHRGGFRFEERCRRAGRGDGSRRLRRVSASRHGARAGAGLRRRSHRSAPDRSRPPAERPQRQRGVSGQSRLCSGTAGPRQPW